MNKKNWYKRLFLIIGIIVFATPLVTSAYTFQKPLDIGSQDEDIVALQQILKDNNFFTYPEITGYFGSITQDAVKSFQKAKGIVSVGTPQTTGYGRVGPQTIAALNALDTSSDTTKTSSATEIDSFVRDLKLGMEGDDVKVLQQSLNANGFFVSATGAGSLGNETTFFGPATQSALIKFQISNNILPAIGFFGPLTRAKLLEPTVSSETITSSLEDPQELKIDKVGTDYVRLSWNAVDDATSYIIKRKEVGENDYVVVGTSTNPSYIDASVSSRTNYLYTITALNEDGQSYSSLIVDVYTKNPVRRGGSSSNSGSSSPSTPNDTTAPELPTGLSVNAGDANATITWEDPVDSDLVYISIYRGTTSDSLILLATTTSAVETYTDVPISNGTTYYYALTSVDSTGNESVQTSQASDTPSGIYDIYVDSVAGDDANDGSSDYESFATLAAARTSALSLGNGVKIGLKKGGYWRESLNLSTLQNVSISSYGDAGDPPIIDSSDVLSGWTKTAGYTNVYQATTTKVTGNIFNSAWEDNVDLIAKTSIAQVDAAPGSAYINTAGSDNILYVRASDSGNPGSNSKVYETTTRLYGVDLSGISTTGTHQIGGSVEGVYFRRNLMASGSVIVGESSVLKRVVAYQGHYHNAFIGDGVVEDLIVLDKHQVTGGGMLVAYFNGLGAKQLSVKRFYAIGIPVSPDIVENNSDACINHADGGGVYSTMNFEQFAVLNVSASIDCTANSSNYIGGYLKNSSNITSSGTILSTSTISDVMINGRHISAKWGNAYTALQNIASYNGPSIWTMSSSTISKSAFVNSSVPMTQGQTQNLVFNHNIAVASGGGSPVLQTNKANYVGDYNVFYYPVDARTVYILGSGVNYFTLASWQVASGQDMNSVYLTTAQFNNFWLGDPSTGDFRINPSAQVTGANGTVYTGTFPDGTPITEAGPQEHWDWNSGSQVSGPPTEWPNIPDTIDESKDYINDPDSWDF